MKWEHLNILQRRAIASGLANKKKLIDIAKIVELDPTSVSKEIKRNRIKTKQGQKKNEACKHILRYPYSCNGCSRKYQDCPYDQYKYLADNAQEKADLRLVKSRVGINMTEEEFNEVDRKVKEGIKNKESIYHIVKNNDDMPSTPTIYRWIKEKKLTTTWMDLPYAKTYKKRKKMKSTPTLTIKLIEQDVPTSATWNIEECFLGNTQSKWISLEPSLQIANVF